MAREREFLSNSSSSNSSSSSSSSSNSSSSSSSSSRNSQDWISPAGIELAFIKYEQLKTMIRAASPVAFCCAGFASASSFAASADCPYPNALRRSFFLEDGVSASILSTNKHQQLQQLQQQLPLTPPDPAAAAAAAENGANGDAAAADGSSPAAAAAAAAGTTPAAAAAGTTPAGTTPAAAAAAGAAAAAAAAAGVPVFPVPLYDLSGEEREIEFSLLSSGIYFLIISNCGPFSDLKILKRQQNLCLFIKEILILAAAAATSS
ncbi:lung seven transmembrane receptor domain-containing protein, putative [Eimeria acervulina]|uniref:Lung seven transmembrane receptor domain-containing protein, putative n=1 Tax=Eimeria acervulina TaxID=5801 RepID=U6GAX0_EIMAC|nr:lung seven transmembrane receptor domain-containing protein, putative [Eimeria acervulina]CDI77280.1 lung seven transmembrane receptor domain-containing protein, putative [Eimeria acervulina]